jgi:glutamate/tyrosine decarboxylase-like PLP-dependent enzyme
VGSGETGSRPRRFLGAAEGRVSDSRYDVLDDAARLARQYLDGLSDRPVGARAGLDELRAGLMRPLTDEGEDPRLIVENLARDVDGGLIASAGPRFFGFVIGGSVPAALAADWLVSAWDQNGGGFVASPALSVVEEVAATWVRELLGVPASSGVGFVTGCQMANFTCLAAARHAVLRDAGWDVEANGLQGAPRVRILAGEYAHVTIAVACRLLGLGQDLVHVVPADDQGRMRPDALREALGGGSGDPTIVCAQAGEINTGAFDPFVDIAQACREHRAWLHIDGAFGLWAAASPRRRNLLEGAEQANSWATDGHKWLNVPYDCGIAIVADTDAHRAAMTSTSAYIPSHDDGVPWGYDWTPELSRRARGVTVYAALRELGRGGLADLVDRCCDHARLISQRLAAVPGVEIVNDVVLNQVLVRFGDDDARTRAVIEQVQRDGTCWLSGSTFRGRTVMRISVVGWQTTTADAERSAGAIIAAARLPLTVTDRDRL